MQYYSNDFERSPGTGFFKGSSSAIIITLIIAFYFYYDKIGFLANSVFSLISFDYKYPYLTIFILSIIYSMISNIITLFSKDTIEQILKEGKNNILQEQYEKAKEENNLFKIKKIEKEMEQSKINNNESIFESFKDAPLTILAALPHLSWLKYFLSLVDSSSLIQFPFKSLSITSTFIWMPITTLLLFFFKYFFSEILTNFIKSFLLYKYIKKISIQNSFTKKI